MFVPSPNIVQSQFTWVGSNDVLSLVLSDEILPVPAEELSLVPRKSCLCHTGQASYRSWQEHDPSLWDGRLPPRR